MDDTNLYKGNCELWIFLNNRLNNVSKANEKDFKGKVSQVPVYVKKKDQLLALNQCYLPKEYTGNETLERLAEQHVDIKIDFVSDLYLSNKTLSTGKWASLFGTFCVKTDVKDFVLYYLVPEIKNINEDNLIAVTKLFFENKAVLKEELSNLKLRLKTIGGKWLPAKETILGSYYSESVLENQILPSIQLSNAISSEYANTGLRKWYEFFKELGALEYQSEQDLITAKIQTYVVDSALLNKRNGELTFSFVKELIELNIAEKLSGKNLEVLRSMPVLLKGDKTPGIYEKASQCHFAAEYAPKLNLEKIIPVEKRPNIFISAAYLNKSGTLKDVKGFFQMIGISEGFFVLETASKARSEMDPNFIQFIDEQNVSIKAQAVSYAYNHVIKPWRELAYKQYLHYPEVSTVFWEKIRSSERFFKDVFEPLSYSYYLGTPSIPSYINWFIQHTPSIVAKDGKCYKPSELYAIKLEAYVNNASQIPQADLRGLKYGDKSLEGHLGFKTVLSLDLCIERFNKIKDVTQLQKEGIWDMFLQQLEKDKLSAADSAALAVFSKQGFLPNQLKVWKNIKELYFIQDDFNPGIGKSQHLVHDELKPVARLLGITGLCRDDFNPEFRDLSNECFKEQLLARLKYIALAENAAEWESQEQKLKDVITSLNFHRSSRISFSFKKVEPPIENTEKTFYVERSDIYYVGNWQLARAAELFTYIHNILSLKNISLRVLQDILLLSEIEILDFFDEKNIKYPETWRKVLQPQEPNNNDNKQKATPHKNEETGPLEQKQISNSAKSELTDEEVAELEALLNRTLSSNEMTNTLIIAIYRALKYYESSGYNIADSIANIEECIRKRVLEGIIEISTGDVRTIIVRSAKKGILHLNYQSWVDLNDACTELFVVTGNNLSDFLIFSDQQSLSSVNKDSWVAKIGGEDKYTEFSALLKGEYVNENKKFAPFQLLIRIKDMGEYESIFERIYVAEETADFGELD